MMRGETTYFWFIKPTSYQAVVNIIVPDPLTTYSDGDILYIDARSRCSLALSVTTITATLDVSLYLCDVLPYSPL